MDFWDLLRERLGGMRNMPTPNLNSLPNIPAPNLNDIRGSLNMMPNLPTPNFNELGTFAPSLGGLRDALTAPGYAGASPGTVPRKSQDLPSLGNMHAILDPEDFHAQGLQSELERLGVPVDPNETASKAPGIERGAVKIDPSMLQPGSAPIRGETFTQPGTRPYWGALTGNLEPPTPGVAPEFSGGFAGGRIAPEFLGEAAPSEQIAGAPAEEELPPEEELDEEEVPEEEMAEGDRPGPQDLASGGPGGATALVERSEPLRTTPVIVSDTSKAEAALQGDAMPPGFGAPNMTRGIAALDSMEAGNYPVLGGVMPGPEVRYDWTPEGQAAAIEKYGRTAALNSAPLGGVKAPEEEQGNIFARLGGSLVDAMIGPGADQMTRTDKAMTLFASLLEGAGSGLAAHGGDVSGRSFLEAAQARGDAAHEAAMDDPTRKYAEYMMKRSLEDSLIKGRIDYRISATAAAKKAEAVGLDRVVTQDENGEPYYLLVTKDTQKPVGPLKHPDGRIARPKKAKSGSGEMAARRREGDEMDRQEAAQIRSTILDIHARGGVPAVVSWVGSDMSGNNLRYLNEAIKPVRGEKPKDRARIEEIHRAVNLDIAGQTGVSAGATSGGAIHISAVQSEDQLVDGQMVQMNDGTVREWDAKEREFKD